MVHEASLEGAVDGMDLLPVLAPTGEQVVEMTGSGMDAPEFDDG